MRVRKTIKTVQVGNPRNESEIHTHKLRGNTHEVLRHGLIAQGWLVGRRVEGRTFAPFEEGWVRHACVVQFLINEIYGDLIEVYVVQATICTNNLNPTTNICTQSSNGDMLVQLGKLSFPT